jgi:hypothetical protein
MYKFFGYTIANTNQIFANRSIAEKTCEQSGIPTSLVKQLFVFEKPEWVKPTVDNEIIQENDVMDNQDWIEP